MKIFMASVTYALAQSKQATKMLEVRLIRSLKPPSTLAASLVVAGLLVLAAAAVWLATSHKGNLAFNDVPPVAANTRTADAIKDESQPLDIAAPTEGNSSASQTVPNPSSASSQTTNQQGNAQSQECSSKMEDREKAYEREVQKERDSLDDKLLLLVGINISSEYVEDYNAKVTDLLKKYTEIANNSNCTFPIKQPALLPANYLPLR